MYPLILRDRLIRSGNNPISLGIYRKDETLPEWLSPLRAADGFAVESRRGGYTYLHFPATKPALGDMVDELRADRAKQGFPSDTTLELVTLLLTRGIVQERYGSWFNPLNEDVNHVLTCGINWAKGTSPGSEQWREWAGTFEEESRTDMLSVTVFCRCSGQGPRGHLRNLTGVNFGIEMPSIADLIVALSGSELERLFGE